MNQTLYERRCKCKEEVSITKKRKVTSRRESKPLRYPNPSVVTSTTFLLKYKENLSSNAKLILNSFQKKYFYHAVDDLLYLPSSNSNLTERENLLALLYSPILSLQNDSFVDFFDIWIHEIYINEKQNSNRFLISKSTNCRHSNYITVKFFYKTKSSIKKQEFLW